MDSYIIQIQPQDELTSIIDKIIHTQAEQIYLLVPDASRMAQHALNFRLLKREAEGLGKEIIVVSASPRVQTLALKASLKAHQETAELKQGAVKSTRSAHVSPKKVSDIIASSSASPSAPKKTEKGLEEFEEEENKARDSVLEKVEIKNMGRKITNFWKKESPPFDAEKKETRADTALPRAKVGSLLLYRMYARVRRVNTKTIFKASLIFLVGVSCVLAGLTFYFVLPKAKITIEAAREEVLVEVGITGSKDGSNADSKKLTVPAQIFEKSIEGSKLVKTTTEKEVRIKARGVIKVYNSYSSAPQTLVQNTRFVSETGKLFRTTETISVPGAKIEGGSIVPSSISVKVTAADAGEEYNIAPANFSIPGLKGTPKYLAFYGKSENRMEGGKIGRVKVVSEADYASATERLSKDLQAQAKTELGILVPPDFLIPEGSENLSHIEITSSKNIGDEGEDFSLSGALKVKAFAVREADIIGIVEKDFEVKFPGKILLEQGRAIQYEVREKDFEKGLFEMKVAARGIAEVLIDAGKIREGIRGKEEGEVRAYVAGYQGIKEARVSFWPFWVARIPEDVSRIQVIIQ